VVASFRPVLAWSPLLIQKLDVRAPGFVLRRLQLNRHRETEVAPHAHADFAQLILYLDGHGTQLVRDRRHEAGPGDLFVIPPGVPHGFALVAHSRPLCLVLEFETTRPRRRVAHRRLPPDLLYELHALLARIPTKGRPKLSDYPALVAVAARLLAPATRRADRGRHTRRPARPPLFEIVAAPLQTGAAPAAIARATGYHRDYLSRRLKLEQGLGLRALRDRWRLSQAEAALRAEATVAVAAARAGFDDPNYFSRWFRRQTGSTPSAWQAEHGR
jgi:AraC-like DNA-binding protein/mannose-6-phosphate isomerase-like protein (cupin superfamily)